MVIEKYSINFQIYKNRILDNSKGDFGKNDRKREKNFFSLENIF